MPENFLYTDMEACGSHDSSSDFGQSVKQGKGQWRTLESTSCCEAALPDLSKLLFVENEA